MGCPAANLSEKDGKIKIVKYRNFKSNKRNEWFSNINCNQIKYGKVKGIKPIKKGTNP